MKRPALVLALIVLGLAATAPAAHARALPDSYAGRLKALALVQALDLDLLGHDSATAVLQRWCDAHAMAPGAKIQARLLAGADQPLPAAARQALGLGADVAVRYRRVRLACGTHVLSEAENWYLPGALTPEMNGLLDHTDTPFGVVVKALDFRRRNLTAELLFQALAPGWEMRPPPPAKAGALPVPPIVLRHTAALTTGAGAPLAYVVESYTAAVLDF